MVLKRAGMPTGCVYCVLHLPSLDLRDRRYFYPSHQMTKLRRFLQRSIPVADETREDASFTVSAEVRHRDNQGYRWVVLCRWRAGEPIHHALEEAAARWKELEERKQL